MISASGIGRRLAVGLISYYGVIYNSVLFSFMSCPLSSAFTSSTPFCKCTPLVKQLNKLHKFNSIDLLNFFFAEESYETPFSPTALVVNSEMDHSRRLSP